MRKNQFNGVLRLVRGFVALVAVFIVAKCLFVACYPGIYSGESAVTARAVWHGLAMDCSMAGYLCVIPALVITAGIWWPRRWLDATLRIYTAVAAVAVAMAVVADTVLYGYWGFKLDTTALFYFVTSPSAAMASVAWWMPVAGVAATALAGWGIYALLWRMWRPRKGATQRRGVATALMVAAMAVLALAIRGGVTVSTMNLSSAYFSPRAELNHAAVNPLFSFMYSATHQSRFADQFRYFDAAEARAHYDWLLAPDGEMADSAVAAMRPKLSTSRPDIYIVILESFSSHLMPSLGGDTVAVRLDSMARSGVLFTDFYASSFRTDRSLPAILSGYPAQPTTSIMKYVDKTDRLPSLPAVLKANGYGLEYYYGGDANFTNMKAYLVSAGFDRIVSDKDFPVSERLSKWGVHDDRLFSYVTERIAARGAESDGRPMLTVIQTSSSHEPFEVPYTSRFDNPRLNAFAYADHYLGEWVDALRADSARWARSLVVMVPDHWAVWPQGLQPGPERHRIPLVMTGGAIASALPATVGLTAAQPDIAATLIGMLGLKRPADMPFSHDIFDPSVGRSAFFSEPGVVGLVTPRGTAVVNVATGATESGPEPVADAARAYLQTLYDDLDKR